jgi:hypothetical protein
MVQSLARTPTKDSAAAPEEKTTRAVTRSAEQSLLSAVGNQAIQRSLKSSAPPFIQRKCACGASTPNGGTCEECQGKSVQAKLVVGAVDDPLEHEADRVADRILRMVDPEVSAATPPSIRAKERSSGAKPDTTRDTDAAVRATSGAGAPLPDGVRSYYEPRFGRDFSAVRVHTGSDAIASARALNARAYTLGRNIAFDDGELRPDSPAGRRLLAHELAHVVQQGGAPARVIQRQEHGEGGGTGGEGGEGGTVPAESVADRRARDAGPCGVAVRTLTNEGLLFQLNRARLFVTEHDPHREGSSDSESDYYDYQNLLRRLTRERQRRVTGGHVWLAEPAQIHAPEQLYSLLPGDALGIQVRSVAGASVAGEFTASATTYLTRSQFEQFLAQNDIPTLQMESLLEGEGMDRAVGDPATLDLPRRVARRMALDTGALDRSGLFGMPAPMAPFDPMASLFPMLRGGTRDPFGLDPLGRGGMGASPFTLPYRSEEYTPLASETLGDVRRAPGGITSSRPEVLFLPPVPRVPASSGGAPVGPGPFAPGLGPYDTDMPEGVGALGFLGRPGAMPDGTTGFIWEGSHVTDMSFLYGRPVSRGFRAPFPMHMADTLTGHGGRSTAELNVGTPGSYANDWFFPYAGEAWGRSTGHWGQGPVMIVNADGTPASAAQMIELMATRTPEMAGEEYRFSPPREGTAAFAAADAEARRRGMTGFCPAGGANCENIPFDIHQTAAGGGDLSYTRPDGTVVSIANPEDATARAMSELMNQPPEFWAERGMRRVDLGPRMYASLAAGTGMGMGMQFWSDYQRMQAGEEVAWGRNMALAGGFNIAQTFGEEALTTSMTTRLAMPVAEGGMGMAGSSAMLTSRFAAGTSVAVVAAPVMTGSIMAVDPYQDYTGAEYMGAMGRTVLPAAGSAVAMIAYGAAVGTVAGPIGILVGAGGVALGLLVYAAVDWLTGDAVEGSIREGMGVGGCTDGVEGE